MLEGVQVKPNTQIDQVKSSGADGRVQLKLKDGSELVVDHVVMAVGLEPNVKVAQEAGLELDANRGGVVANAELEARTNVFVGPIGGGEGSGR